MRTVTAIIETTGRTFQIAAVNGPDGAWRGSVIDAETLEAEMDTEDFAQTWGPCENPADVLSILANTIWEQDCQVADDLESEEEANRQHDLEDPSSGLGLHTQDYPEPKAFYSPSLGTYVTVPE